MILVMIFMAIYYMRAGIITNIALLVNAVLMLGAIAAFDVTLTLPGIAGIILTIGMAVDANVLFYERIREELQTARDDLAAAYRQFDQAVDPELVESCVYQISAIQARCNYLIRAIKSRHSTAADTLWKEDAAWT